MQHREFRDLVRSLVYHSFLIRMFMCLVYTHDCEYVYKYLLATIQVTQHVPSPISQAICHILMESAATSL